MPSPKKPDEQKPETKAPEHRTGQQQDDNIDDLGRDINDPDSKPVDQPTGTKS